MEKGNTMTISKMTTREKAVVLQMMLSRNLTLENWDGIKMTMKLVGLRGGMLTEIINE